MKTFFYYIIECRYFVYIYENLCRKKQTKKNMSLHLSIFIFFKMIFPALVFLGLKTNDCCGCCGNESCGKRFAVRSHLYLFILNVL